MKLIEKLIFYANCEVIQKGLLLVGNINNKNNNHYNIKYISKTLKMQAHATVWYSYPFII